MVFENDNTHINDKRVRKSILLSLPNLSWNLSTFSSIACSHSEKFYASSRIFLTRLMKVHLDL